jgi:hypothetical protein
MFRAFSFALAVVLCTSGWSKAQAEPQHVTFENGKIILDPPVEFGWGAFTYKRSEIELPTWTEIGVWSTAFCTPIPKCRRIVGDKLLRLGNKLAH